MEDPNPDRQAVEELIRAIIERGASYDAEALESLYDDGLQVVRVGVDGQVRVTDKAHTLRFYRTMRESGAPPLSQAARVRVVEIAEGSAHVLVLREMQADGMPRRLVFSLDCRRGADGWRVVREVAVAQS